MSKYTNLLQVTAKNCPLSKKVALHDLDEYRRSIAVQSIVLDYQRQPIADFNDTSLSYVPSDLAKYVLWVPCLILYRRGINQELRDVVIYNGEKKRKDIHYVDSGLTPKQWLDKNLGRQVKIQPSRDEVLRHIVENLAIQEHEKYLDTLLKLTQPKYVLLVASASDVNSEIAKFQSEVRKLQTEIVTISEKDMQDPFYLKVVRNLGYHPRIFLFKYEDWIQKNPSYTMYSPGDFQTSTNGKYALENLLLWYDHAIYML